MHSLIFGPRFCCVSGLQWLVAERAPAWFWRCGTSLLTLLGPVGQRAFAHIIHALERSRKVWAAGELVFFLLKKEPMVLSELIEFGPCFST